MSAQPQPRPPVPNNQQKGPAKAGAMQRQLNQPQHTINNSVSCVHLVQPPPVDKRFVLCENP